MVQEHDMEDDCETFWGWCDIHSMPYEEADGGCTNCMDEWSSLSIHDPRHPDYEDPDLNSEEDPDAC